jgi:hypothetical protein
VLTKLEQDALAIKVHSRRQEVQADLNRKRDMFEQLTERLRELDEIGIDSEDDDSEDGEDLLSEIIQTPSDSVESATDEQPGEYDAPNEQRDVEEEQEEEQETTVIHNPLPRPDIPPSTMADQTSSTTRGEAKQPGTTVSQALRSRTRAAEPPADTAESSARAQLFGNRPGSATTALSTTATTEAILDHQRAEQDRLTESLVDMASRLKAQSKTFSSTLEEDKDVLSTASTGLEKNERGLDAASRGIGTLRRMSEGQGWLGRMLLYLWIFGMMVLAVVIVFVLPKLRF